MNPVSRQNDDVVTLPHAVPAVGVVRQLILGLVKHVPAGIRLGVRDWHREAFEIHAVRPERRVVSIRSDRTEQRPEKCATDLDFHFRCEK